MIRWMENLDPKLRDQPLICLAIPGSHNTISYTCLPANGLSPDYDPVVTVMYKALKGRGRKFVYNWCATQDVEVSEQLNWGVRYLDFRIATKPNDHKLYFCHGLYGSEISTVMWEINHFLEENPGEIVIMDFRHFYEFTVEAHELLINNYIRETFGNKLCPYVIPRTDVTLNWMLKRGYRVIVIYRNYETEVGALDGLWPGKSWITHWPDTNDIETMKEFNDEKLKTRDTSRGLITQMIITPSSLDAIMNANETLGSLCVKPVHEQLMYWLTSKKPGTEKGCINVVMADCIDTREFYQNVVLLNESWLMDKLGTLPH